MYLNKEESFMLLPGAFVDFVGGESFASVVLAFGYSFWREIEIGQYER